MLDKVKKPMIIRYKTKTINVPVHKVFFIGIGLMFRGKNTNNLLFDFGKNVRMAIHSVFVFFDFLAVWLDENNQVIDVKLIKPFSLHFCPKESFFRLVEIPINEKNKEIIEFFVGKR